MTPPTNRFETHDTRTRLALVESHLEEQDGKLDDVVDEVRGLRSDFNELRIDLAKRLRSEPPKADGIVISGRTIGLLVPLAASVGAGLLKLIEFVAQR